MGQMLDRPISTKESEHEESSGGSLRLKWASSCMQGWRVSMEDAHICLPEVVEGASGKSYSSAWRSIGLFGVMDGHGGEQVAKFCKRHLPQELCACPLTAAAHQDSTGLREALTSAFHRMDELLRDRRTSGPELQALTNAPRAGPGGVPPAATNRPVDVDAVGCTACVCAITKRHLVVANAGDSRAVLCRGGRAVALSDDHKPNNPGERSRIEAAGGYVENSGPGQFRVNGNLNLSRALGDLEYKKDPSIGPEKQIISGTPDVTVQARSEEDEFIVICCDGVWDVKSNQEVVDFMRERISSDPFGDPEELERALEALLDDCLSPDLRRTKGLGGDNMTALCCRLPSQKALASTPPEGDDDGPEPVIEFVKVSKNSPSLVSVRSDIQKMNGSSLVVRVALPEANGPEDISLRVSGPTAKLEVGVLDGMVEVFSLTPHLPLGASLAIPEGDEAVPAAKFFSHSQQLRVSLPMQLAA